MENLFVPYEIAKTLKEKGFDKPCLAYYGKTKFKTGIFLHTKRQLPNSLKFDTIINSTELTIVAAPIYQQVVDWFIEKHKISIHIHPEVKLKGLEISHTNRWQAMIQFIDEVFIFGTSKSKITEKHRKPYVGYYKTLTMAIKEVIKLIK